MSDNPSSSEEEHEGPVAPRRVVGTPPPSPPLLSGSAEVVAEEPVEGRLPAVPEDVARADKAERLIAAIFVLAFLAGCGFVAAYVGLEVHSVNAVFRSNLALGLSLSVVLLALGAGSLLWVRHLMPDVETEEERHDLRSSAKERAAFQEYAVEGGRASQVGKRKLARRTLMLATAPLAVAPVVLLRDLGPLPGTSLRHTVWSPGRRLLVYGTNTPLSPAMFNEPGSMITIVPDGYTDNQDELAKAAVILIKFEPGQLDHFPERRNGSTLLGTVNWTVDNIVAYSKICTHVGCPVALYEQTTHHILCPCHQSTFDATKGAEVIFGPAARPLPQLPLTTDSEGYLVAKSDFQEPVGPSFWERG
ncbi:MAG TPA: Rieske 2Fe-2S domain-containing protein [Streptosporangiaceae bacterium]|nr:Rieske 2Fe-2S domain-containing protein [Streptosporangiaceae bacterium]